jgi:hypothetical protein
MEGFEEPVGQPVAPRVRAGRGAGSVGGPGRWHERHAAAGAGPRGLRRSGYAPRGPAAPSSGPRGGRAARLHAPRTARRAPRAPLRRAAGAARGVPRRPRGRGRCVRAAPAARSPLRPTTHHRRPRRAARTPSTRCARCGGPGGRAPCCCCCCEGLQRARHARPPPPNPRGHAHAPAAGLRGGPGRGCRRGRGGRVCCSGARRRRCGAPRRFDVRRRRGRRRRRLRGQQQWRRGRGAGGESLWQRRPRRAAAAPRRWVRSVGAPTPRPHPCPSLAPPAQAVFATPSFDDPRIEWDHKNQAVLSQRAAAEVGSRGGARQQAAPAQAARVGGAAMGLRFGPQGSDLSCRIAGQALWSAAVPCPGCPPAPGPRSRAAPFLTRLSVALPPTTRPRPNRRYWPRPRPSWRSRTRCGWAGAGRPGAGRALSCHRPPRAASPPAALRRPPPRPAHPSPPGPPRSIPAPRTPQEREALLSKRKATNRELEKNSNVAAGAVPSGDKPWERVLRCGRRARGRAAGLRVPRGARVCAQRAPEGCFACPRALRCSGSAASP